MKNFVSAMVQALESRTLLSASPSTGFRHSFTPPDAVIQADLNKIKTDGSLLSAAYTKDSAAIKTASQNLATAIKTARANVSATLTSKLTTDQGTVKTDFGLVQAVYTKDEPAIIGDYKQIWIDRKTPTALAADKLKLTTDQGTLKTDLATPAANLKAAITAVGNDQSAITTAVNADAGVVAAKAALKAAAVDVTAAQTQLTADLKQLGLDIKNHA